ncbi:TPA: hypothetical protein PC598_004196 [Morganella morganii]|nr:hypothetical protein [Morganella morganii]
MKKLYYSLIFATSNLSKGDILKDFGNNVRFINMSANSKGFAGNKGLTNDFFLTNKEFIWIFESKEKRNKALKRLNRILNGNILHVLKIKTLMSPSRAAKCNSIRQPKLSAKLRSKWQVMISKPAVTSHLSYAF